MKRVVYTAIADEHNQLRDHPHIPDVEWVAFVTMPQKYADSNWNVQPLFSYGEVNPRQQETWYKVQSLLELAEYDRTMWLDGSCEILSTDYFKHLLDVSEDPISLFPHQSRDCIYQEAGPIREQVNYYRREYEHPPHWGLWVTGLIVRNRCPDVNRVERLWWNEIDHWSCQDQLSLPVVLRNLDIEPKNLFVNDFYNNGLFKMDAQ